MMEIWPILTKMPHDIYLRGYLGIEIILSPSYPVVTIYLPPLFFFEGVQFCDTKNRIIIGTVVDFQVLSLFEYILEQTQFLMNQHQENKQ